MRRRARLRTAVSLSSAATLIATGIWSNVVFSACGAPPVPRQPVPSFRQYVVTITPTGIRAAVYAGPPAQFEFRNDDTVAHAIASDPHPAHDRCVELNVGTIAPGRQVYVNFPVRGRVCGYHDETRVDDRRFQGSIVIR